MRRSWASWRASPQVITAAVARAAPNYMPLTRQANQEVFILGPSALPDGPHRVKAAQK